MEEPLTVCRPRLLMYVTVSVCMEISLVSNPLHLTCMPAWVPAIGQVALTCIAPMSLDYDIVYVMQGYKHKKAFIIAQAPHQERSCNEFWKIVYQYNCGTIVMLSQLIEYNQQVCCPYWPKAGSEVYGDYSVEFISETREESLITMEFQVTCTSNEVHVDL